MQPERPLITIAIPTYNRHGFLAKLLAVLAPQLADEARVELIVSDNASSDDTPAVIRNFQQEGLRLTYIRNEVNRGPDANFLQCFERANGKYVWIVGDDDIIVPAAIGKILTYLSKEEYDLVYVSSYGIQSSHETRPVNSKVRASVFHTPEELARRVHVFFTFMSGNIVNKDRVCSAAHLPFPTLIGTNLVQLGWVYTALNGHRRSLLIHEPLVGATVANTGGYGLFTVFGPNLAHITERWIQSDRVKRAILNGTLQKFFPTYLLAAKKADGAFLQETPDHVLRPVFGSNFRYWLFDFPVIIMPSLLARGWVLMGRCVNRLDRIVGHPLMH